MALYRWIFSTNTYRVRSMCPKRMYLGYLAKMRCKLHTIFDMQKILDEIFLAIKPYILRRI